MENRECYLVQDDFHGRNGVVHFSRHWVTRIIYLFGRNFDWEFSPDTFAFQPSDQTDIHPFQWWIFLISGSLAKMNLLTDLPLKKRRNLLHAVEIPFDGMNDQGLAIGMAAVPSDGQAAAPGKPSIDSLLVMREVLDHVTNCG